MNDDTLKALAVWHAATEAVEKARELAEAATETEWRQRLIDAGVQPCQIVERPEYIDGPLRRFAWSGEVKAHINYYESIITRDDAGLTHHGPVFTPMATGEFVRKDGRSYHPPRLAYVPADRLIIEGGVI